MIRENMGKYVGEGCVLARGDVVGAYPWGFFV
jgi:hypothetical protein